MKKIFALVLTGILLSSFLMGCGNDPDHSDGSLTDLISRASDADDELNSRTNDPEDPGNHDGAFCPYWETHDVAEPDISGALAAAPTSVTVAGATTEFMRYSTLFAGLTTEQISSVLQTDSFFTERYTAGERRRESLEDFINFSDDDSGRAWGRLRTDLTVGGNRNDAAYYLSEFISDYAVTLRNWNHSEYTSPNQLEFEMRGVYQEDELASIQDRAISLLSDLIPSDWAEYVVYCTDNDTKTEKINDSITSDGAIVSFYRYIDSDEIYLNEEKLETWSFSLRIIIENAEPQIMTKYQENYIPDDYTFLLDQRKYELSDFMGADSYGVLSAFADKNTFIRGYSEDYGLDRKNDNYSSAGRPEIDVTVASYDDGSYYECVETDSDALISGRLDSSYKIATKPDGSLCFAEAKIEGISGNIPTTDDLSEASDAYKKLANESGRCIRYFLPGMDTSFIDTGVLTQAAIKAESKQTFETVFERDFMGNPETYKVYTHVKESAMDTWVGWFEISFRHSQW